MPVPAIVGFVVNVVSNAVIGFPMVITRLSTFMWAIKFSETLDPAVVADAQNDVAQRKILEDRILDDYMRDRGYDISWAIPGMQSVIDPICNNQWREATTARRRDPLAIDLDNDGIETTGIPVTGNPILFDHDANGVKTGTGWLKGDDAWLVLDRNGNGTIDSGRELFGVDTQITVTETRTDTTGNPYVVSYIRNATSGFEALTTLDANGDKIFNAQDAAFSQVRLWRDLNQNGISDTGELLTLTQANITGVSLNVTNANADLGNGNSVTGTAVVTRSSGGSTLAETVNLSASNLNLGDNPFYREFPNEIALTDEARALPEMGGSGVLRDLRQAMSLSPQLAAMVAEFSAAGTRESQAAILDRVIFAWAASANNDAQVSSSFKGSANFELGASLVVFQYTESLQRANDLARLGRAMSPDGLGGGLGITTADHGLWRMLAVLQAFNGQTLWTWKDARTITLAGGGDVAGWSAINSPLTQVDLRMTDQQLDLLFRSLDALRESVYSALSAQTRLSPYLDAVNLQFDESGVSFDAGPMLTMLEQARIARSETGFAGRPQI